MPTCQATDHTHSGPAAFAKVSDWERHVRDIPFGAWFYDRMSWCGYARNFQGPVREEQIPFDLLFQPLVRLDRRIAAMDLTLACEEGYHSGCPVVSVYDGYLYDGYLICACPGHRQLGEP
jgi:hypothetical protein